MLTLTLLEVVLGIDNIVFISIIAGRLPKSQQLKAHNYGLLIALVLRVALLFAISWVVGLKADLITVFGHGFSGRDLILLGGGLFLLFSTTKEIHHKLSGFEDKKEKKPKKQVTFSMGRALAEIAVLNVIFSFDSVLTAVGMVKEVAIMVIAVLVSTVIMIVFASRIGNFVNNNPSVKILALSFLIMIGTLLVAEAFHYEIPKGYAYFAMAFSFGVEMLNMRYDKNDRIARLRREYGEEALKARKL